MSPRNPIYMFRGDRAGICSAARAGICSSSKGLEGRAHSCLPLQEILRYHDILLSIVNKAKIE